MGWESHHSRSTHPRHLGQHSANLSPATPMCLLSSPDSDLFLSAQGAGFNRPYTLNNIERTSLWKDLIQNVHVVHLAVCNADKRGDIAVQIQQRVHLHGRFVLAKPGPRKQRETKIDGGRIQSVQTLMQFHTDGIMSIQRSCDSN